MEIRKREIYRYLGYRNQEPDETILQMIYEVEDLLQNQCQPQSVLNSFSCSVENEWITITDEQSKIQVQSKNLADNLKNCKYVVMFAATLGNIPDMLVRKYEITNITKAAIVQAVGAAMVEAYCDKIQSEVKKTWEKQGLYLRPRFSPGYGDLSLTFQKDIFKLLSCEKRIGLTLTDSLMMLPTKSVTALIGITEDLKDCHIGKCKSCLKKDCEFRDEDNE